GRSHGVDALGPCIWRAPYPASAARVQGAVLRHVIVHVARHAEVSPRAARVFESGMSTNPTVLSRLSAVAPRIEYLPLEPRQPLPADVLFAVEFGERKTPVRARCARVRLEPLAGAGLTEVWYANGTVHTGFNGQIRFAADDHHLAAAIEVD